MHKLKKYGIGTILAGLGFIFGISYLMAKSEETTVGEHWYGPDGRSIS